MESQSYVKISLMKPLCLSFDAALIFSPFLSVICVIYLNMVFPVFILLEVDRFLEYVV